VIDCTYHLFLYVSFPLSIPQADDSPVLFCFRVLQCDPAVGYNLAVSSGVLKHAHVASRLQPPTLLSRMLGTYGMLLTLACLAGYQREVVGSGQSAHLGK